MPTKVPRPPPPSPGRYRSGNSAPDGRMEKLRAPPGAPPKPAGKF